MVICMEWVWSPLWNQWGCLTGKRQREAHMMTPRARVVTQGLSISLYIFIPLACLLVGTTLFFSSNRPPKAESDLVKAAAVQGTSKWLIPDDAYLAKYPPPKVGTDVSHPSPTVASSGPIARRLLSLLTGSLP